tara:strand:+ start:2953 stop:4104 length:1152 start_codon:yes stop_codon:yes gene_type:complete
MKPLVPTSDFPKRDDLIYLNAANVALMYEGCRATISDWYNDVAFNGSINFNESAETEVFDSIHDLAAQLFNVNPTDIAVGSSATELLSSLAWAIAPKKGENIVSTDIVFPSTIYPWQRVANTTGATIKLARGKDNYLDPDDIVKLIDQQTAVVCISHVEYGNGQLFDLEKLSDAAHAVGAFFIIDATQSAGAIPIDGNIVSIDALVCSAYKWLCGPFGVAIMYLNPKLQYNLEPGLVGFRSHKDMWKLDPRKIEYPDTAKKFEFSTMAFGCARGLEASIRYILDIGVKTIFTHNRLLTDQLIAGLIKQNAQIISPVNDKERSAIVTVNFQGCNSATLVQKLKHQQIFVSLRSNTIRFSPHFYNTKDDIGITLDHIRRLLKIIK